MVYDSAIILDEKAYQETRSHEYSEGQAELQIALIAFTDGITGKTYRNAAAKEQNRANNRDDVINRRAPVSITYFEVQVGCNEISKNQSF